MKRLTAAVLCTVLTWMTMTISPTTNSAIAIGQGPCSSSRFDVSRTMAPSVRRWRVRRLIRCVFTAVGIPDQVPEALYVAERESGFYPWAINHALYYEHDCLGLFQMMRMFWRGRAMNLPLRYFPHRDTVSAFQARANVWAAADMVKAAEWGAWSTA